MKRLGTRLSACRGLPHISIKMYDAKAGRSSAIETHHLCARRLVHLQTHMHRHTHGRWGQGPLTEQPEQSWPPAGDGALRSSLGSTAGTVSTSSLWWLAWHFQGPGWSSAPKITIKIQLEGFLPHPSKGQSVSSKQPFQTPLETPGPGRASEEPHPQDLCPKLSAKADLISLVGAQILVSFPGLRRVQPS